MLLFLYNLLLLAGLYRVTALSCSCFNTFLEKVVSRAGETMRRQMAPFVVVTPLGLKSDGFVRSCLKHIEKTSSDMLGFGKNDR